MSATSVGVAGFKGTIIRTTISRSWSIQNCGDVVSLAA